MSWMEMLDEVSSAEAGPARRIDVSDLDAWFGQLQALHNVLGEYAERQSVLSATCEGGRLIEGREPCHGCHWTKDLVVIGCHPRRYIGEDGRSVEQRLKAATGCEASTSVHAGSDKSMDFVPLTLVDNRAEDDLLLSWVSDGQALGGSSEALDVGIGEALMDEVTAGGHTDLTLMEV